MIRQSDNKLFTLIQSMSKSEKSYFRKNAQTFNADSNYWKVFDIITKQKKYNEAEIEEKFKGERFMSYFPVLKNYLYEAIIDSLIQFHSSKNEEAQLHRLKQKALVLSERKLYEAALDVLKKATEQAIGNEFFTLAIDLINIEYKLHTNWKPIDLADYNQSHQKMKDCIAQLQNQQLYQQLNLEFIYWQRKERGLRDKSALAELERIIQNPLLQDITQAKNFTSKLLFLVTYDGYYKMQGRYEESIRYTRQMMQLYADFPAMQQRDPQNYLITVINHANNSYYTQQIEQLYSALQELKKMSFKDSKLENLRFLRYAVLYFNYIKIADNYSYFDSLIAEIEAFLSKNKKELQTQEKRLLYYNVLELHIIQGNYPQALDIILQLHALPATDTQADLQRFTYLLEILVHTELGNELLVESLAAAAQRRLSKKHELYEYEQRWLSLFYKLSKAALLERKTLQKQYLSQFEELAATNPSEKKAAEYFNISEWLRATLRGKSMREARENEK